ncbi:ABC transporter permease [Maribacter sp. ACAM166]|uniref:ABC transporter permease n=1 Tax=Maribacter sp. ACAM166 TaxID=2508996 RepID=UPI0010FD404A|nr:ABC transporter permease [Maribacter sp. ACAM166]TLP82666.1 FtsX-like permease family protein [Maribacter sp. ACAM166]
MFANYFKIAWRSLKKQSFFTFLNIIGLSIGITGALLITLYVVDEVNHDTMFKDVDRIYRIDTDIKFGGVEMKAAEAAAPMAAAMKKDFPQVKQTVRLRTRGSALVRPVGEQANAKETNVAFADAFFFDFFGIDVVSGDAKTALSEPKTLVLTKTAAEKHFGKESALGKRLLLNNTDTYTVSGVIDDLPKNSILRDYSIFMAMEGYPASKENNWGGSNFVTFIKLASGADIEDFQEPLQGMLEDYMLPWAQKYFPGMTGETFEASGNYIRYHTMPLADIHLYSQRDQEMSANGSIQNVYILSFIGLFLMILASVNFMNLSTAHSLKRAKEIGVRKTLGSSTRDLVWQFLTESVLISFLSLVAGMLLSAALLPYFNQLSGKEISIPFTNATFWIIILAATVLLGLFSGSYPASFMSQFEPVKTLQGGGQSSVGGGKVRNALVVFQFGISVFLIVGTLVVFQQLNFIQSKDLGFTKDQILILEDTFSLGNQITVFKDEIKELSQVENATVSGFLPTPSWRSNSSYFEEGARDQESAISIQTWKVDDDYMSTLNMELIAGRDFDKKIIADSLSVIINEATLPIMGVNATEALGMRISEDIEKEIPQYFKVIGVVKNFHFESLKENIQPLGLFMGASTGTMAVKLKAGDFSEALAGIEGIWNNMAPGQPFSYRFMDESFNATYDAEQRLGKIFTVFTFLSILIACLGLFGLAAFNAQKRTKEIGIRKVLGASVGQISFRLTTDFLKMVGIAILIAMPLGWYVMNKWLEDFSYRIEIGFGVFALAAFLAITVAVVTVSFQSIKAAIVNPVKSLRSE